MSRPSRSESQAGHRVYTPLVLRAYDAAVLGFSCRWIWRCPARLVGSLYEKNVGALHLDVGVGTGYFLDRVPFPSERPEITLLDVNENSLAHAARRIDRYQPLRVRGDVMGPIPLRYGHFDSIAASFLFHCLPGDADGSKWRAFDHLAPLLKPDGVLFGATALGAGIKRNWVQRRLMAYYNRKGIFGNTHDTSQALEAALSRNFDRVEVAIEGVVALFSARGPRTGSGLSP